MKTPKLTLEICRFLFNEAENTKQFRKCLESIQDINEANKLIKSIKEYNLTISEFNYGDYLEYEGLFYSTDTYVITREGELNEKDNCHFCSYYEEYTTEPIFTIHFQRGRENQYCQSAIDNCEEVYYYEGEYYHSDSLYENSLCFTADTNEVISMDDAYYDDETDEYYENDRKNFTREYHSNTDVHFVKFTENPKFFIGYEVEKEDKEVKESIIIRDFEAACNNWRKEKDGSLCYKSGFEVISPAFELNTEKIAEIIFDNPTLLTHVNAKVNKDTCGGHINISEDGLNGSQLFDKLKGYTPLFYALYYKRVDKDYSKGKSNKDLINDGSKYQAVRIHRNHLEYRIISGVTNFTTLMWRTKLFEYVLNNPTDCPIQAYYNINSIMKEHISRMYATPEKFDILNSRVIKFTQQFENIVINPYNNPKN